jgi:hypothetical protein
VLTPIFLVYRGGCTFVQKTRNILAAHGALAIIIDDKPSEDVNNVIMSDDTTGMGISIPAMLIDFEDGQKLVTFLATATDDEKNEAALSAEFTIKNPDNRVEYDIWYTSIDDRARDFIAYFSDHALALGSHALMTPRFVSWPCPACDSEFKAKECVSDGKYCASPHKYQQGITFKGREIILEDLREMCLYNIYYKKEPEVWWNYMKHVHSQCYNGVSKLCSKRAHKDLGLNW